MQEVIPIWSKHCTVVDSTILKIYLEYPNWKNAILQSIFEIWQPESQSVFIQVSQKFKHINACNFEQYISLRH